MGNEFTQPRALEQRVLLIFVRCPPVVLALRLQGYVATNNLCHLDDKVDNWSFPDQSARLCQSDLPISVICDTVALLELATNPVDCTESVSYQQW